MPIDGSSAVVDLGQVPVVALARERDVGNRVVTAVAERAPVVELEPLARRAPSPRFVLVAALASVPLVHGSLHRGRDLARGGGGLALRERLPRRLSLGETPGFEPLELLGDGLLDDGAEVAVGHRRAHEVPQPLELVVKLGGGGELDPVAAWGEGLDHRGPGPGRGGPYGRSGRTQSEPGRANSVRTELAIDRSTFIRTQSERRHLGVLSLATLELRPLTSPPAESLGDLEPQISPDGRLLAFVRGGSPSYGNQDVWVQPVSGGEARRLTSGQYGFASALSWTPDGTEIVFTNGRPDFGGGRIARVPLAGGAP